MRTTITLPKPVSNLIGINWNMAENIRKKAEKALEKKYPFWDQNTQCPLCKKGGNVHAMIWSLGWIRCSSWTFRCYKCDLEIGSFEKEVGKNEPEASQESNLQTVHQN